MKKLLKGIGILILTCILIFMLIWFLSIIKCEYLTLMYGGQFEEVYKENTMIGDVYRFKVIEYNDKYAEVYYVSGNKETGSKGGDTLKFKRVGNKWTFTGAWSTVWSKYGSADGFIWPYGR